MPVRELRPLFDQVAHQTLSVADAERYLQLHHSPAARRVKSVLAGLLLLIFLAVGLFLINHGFQLAITEQSATTLTNTASPWQPWLPLLLFGGFGSLLGLVSVVGLVSLGRSINRPDTPSLTAIRSGLQQVAIRTLTVDEAMSRLFLPEPPAAPQPASVVTRLFVTIFLLVVVYFSLRQAHTSYRLLTTGKEADGQVISMVRNRKHTATAPVVRYAVDGNQYELTGGTYSSPAAYAVGDRVTVLYNPASPAEAAIRSFSDQWTGPLLAVCLAGVFLFFLWRRSDRSNR